MSWTEEKVRKLKDLWGKGQTASQLRRQTSHQVGWSITPAISQRRKSTGSCDTILSSRQRPSPSFREMETGLQPANWELYDLANDPNEINDLAEENPKQVQALAKHWEAKEKEFVSRGKD